MKKILKKLSCSLFTSSLLLAPLNSFAGEVSSNTSDLGFFVAEDPTLVNSGGDSTSNLYKLLSDGTVTLLQKDIFPDVSTNTFTSNDFTVDERNGKIYFLEGDRGGGQGKRYRKYDIENNEFEGYIDVTGLPDGANPINMGVIQKLNDTIEKKCESSDSDCDDSEDTNFISLGGQGNSELLRIDNDGISQGGSTGKSLIKYSGDELHIGENSLITKEEDGVQKLYAKDENGNAIDIDITNGSKLLIDGVEVTPTGTIPQVTTNKNNISTNTANISSNKDNIKNLGEGIASSTALTAALSALPQTSKESKVSCGVGTGAYSSKYAIGFGCASKLNERVDLNAGGSYVFGGSKSYGEGTLDSGIVKAGFVFKLGEIKKDIKISLKEKEELKQEISDLKANNNQIISQNKALLSRLERLEKIALSETKFQDLATIKLP